MQLSITHDMGIVARCRWDQTIRFNVRENKHKPRTGSVSPTRTAFQSWPNCKRLQSLNQPSCLPTNHRRPLLSHFHIKWFSGATPAASSQWEFASPRAGLFFRLHIYFWWSAVTLIHDRFTRFANQSSGFHDYIPKGKPTRTESHPWSPVSSKDVTSLSFLTMVNGTFQLDKPSRVSTETVVKGWNSEGKFKLNEVNCKLLNIKEIEQITSTTYRH